MITTSVAGATPESNHVREGIHLDSVHACGVEDSCGESVERIEDHSEEDQDCAGCEDCRDAGPGTAGRYVVNTEGVDDCGESAEGVAEGQRVRNRLEPAVSFKKCFCVLFHGRFRSWLCV